MGRGSHTAALFFIYFAKCYRICYLLEMIHLTKGNTETVIFTLKEKQTLTMPNYLFVFENRSTKSMIKFVKLAADNTSTYKDRFDKFSIKVNNYFSREDSGEWLYYIYEQASATNINPESATGLLEEGIMRLNESADYSFTEYATDNTYITR